MSTKKSAGKLLGTQRAQEKMRFDSTAAARYEQAERENARTKQAHKLRPKGLNVALAQGYGPDNFNKENQ